ncbi:LIF receptor subunit alpha a [Cololabis saira]|uniref:LIF receptor subunit alpha a n=1 Tax=Cololabis saira TaxID=129043 RepID=UPI002AD5473C|nr:LIF receptor subunit alpha a [Cololabis saira]
MSYLSISSSSKPHRSFVWFICVLLSFCALNTYGKIVLTVPEQVSLSPDMPTQKLSISWLGGAATTFDLIILRTEFNETVFYDTVSAIVNHDSGRHQWNWTSVEPLECTSLSVKVRSRDGQATSGWSETQILQGRDLPINPDIQVYPKSRTIPVGANTTFCCIMGEGKFFKGISYGNKAMDVTRLSRRTYATTAFHQGPSQTSGANILCTSTIKNDLSGVVVFVGYPPLLKDFACETRDLITAVCQWKEARNTLLYGKRRTRYSLNKRNCNDSSQLTCSLPRWDRNLTLVAENPLGRYSLSDSAELSHRVCPVAPVEVDAPDDGINAWNATVQWQWTYSSYSSLALVCQVELDNSGLKTKRVFTGVGLQSAFLSDLHPDEEYSVRVHCGAQKNFWKWGFWSKPFSFTTKTYVPDAPDVWMWMNKDNTGLVVWKLLTRQQSHGHITGYEVTLWNPEENLQHTEVVPPDTHSVRVNLTQMSSFSSDATVIATVIAKSYKGASPTASVPLRSNDVEPPNSSRTVYTNSGFSLFWQRNDSSSCSYVVEWYDASCAADCPVEWLRVAAGSTNVSIESANFQPGVRYNFSLKSCPSDSLQLMERWQGYTQELVPSSPVHLRISRDYSSVILTWEEIPLVDRRGFLLGYNVYINNGSQLTLLANLSDLGMRKYAVKGLSEGVYKFTVKAYTSAGEDTGATVSITMEPRAEGLILEMLATLGIVTILLLTVTFICFKKRKWVKKAFYPDIPEPKLPTDWSRTQGPLDIKPARHSMVHIVEKPERDSSKEMLVVIPEEDEDYDGQGIEDESVDTDEPLALRYYNQVVDDRPIRPRFPDSSVSSASSLDSAHTDVTYTGIQTSGSSLVFQPDPQGSCGDGSASFGDGAGGYRPQMNPKPLSDEMGLDSPEPFLEPQVSSSGGYKPQTSWHLDSPTEACDRSSLAPSLGSPTSIASTQFLLPDGEEHAEEKRQLSSAAATWFSNLLSSTKP